jgi:aerobic-type carbon monoxide dehydrogenase small subunit (CoxS/CutS family)/carbon monoxide dehydrogenase subunit G
MSTHKLNLVVNGKEKVLQAEARTQVCELLREDLNLTGTHVGCEQGVCGACTIMVNGKPQRSCISFAGDIDQSEIRTVEGFDQDEVMEALRSAFSRHHALQCGFCTPGMLITSYDIVTRMGEVDSATIRKELSGNICRCTGYVGIVEAIEEVAKGRRPVVVGKSIWAGVKNLSAVPANNAPIVQRSDPASPAPSVGAKVDAQSKKGWNSLEKRLEVAFSADQVWQKMSDVRGVAACIPGAEITTLEGESLSGKMNVALGPMKVSFNGDGSFTLDHSARKGRLLGAGKDSGSGSAASGEVDWSVEPVDEGRSVIVVGLAWRLSGRLAQFSRGGLVLDIINRLATVFVENLEASLRGEDGPPKAVKSLSIMALLWAAIRDRLFGRRS